MEYIYTSIIVHCSILRDPNHSQFTDRIVPKVKEIGWKGLDRIDVAHDRNKCSAVENAAMNLPAATKRGVFLDWLKNHTLLKKRPVPWRYSFCYQNHTLFKKRPVPWRYSFCYQNHTLFKKRSVPWRYFFCYQSPLLLRHIQLSVAVSIHVS